MNTKAIRIIVLGALLAAGSADAKTKEDVLGAGTPELRGQTLARELAARNDGYRDLAGEVEMVLRDKSGGEAKRHFTVKILEKPDAASGDYSLIVFDNPADVKGTAVLSHARPGSDDEQWLYLPATHRVKRISSSNRNASFVGSEFTFEDLTGAEGRKYNWKLLGTEPCSLGECFTVETTPRDAGSSSYSKRVLHVDTAEFRILAVDFYDRTGTMVKTLAYDDYKKMNGKYWRAQSWTMNNRQSGKSTVIRFSSMRLGNGFTVSDFAPGKLEG